MRMFILCTLLALARSGPQEWASMIKSKEDVRKVRGSLVGDAPICPNISPFREPHHKSILTAFRFCWADPGWDLDKRKSEDAARAWERAARIELEFLDNCNNNRGYNRNSYVTPIYIQDVVPFVDAYFKDCKFKAERMVLNFELTHPNMSGCNDPAFRENCIKSIAMHEMGHAIGFRHEQDHPNSVCDDTREVGIYNVLTEYDPHSIMNYCNEAMISNPQLSQKDIEGARRVFGQRKS